MIADNANLARSKEAGEPPQCAVKNPKEEEHEPADMELKIILLPLVKAAIQFGKGDAAPSAFHPADYPAI
jgi:hypothetical protein